MNEKSFYLNESSGFRLRIELKPCMRPVGLNSLNFVQESLKDGEVVNSSTYNFFLDDEQVKELCQKLGQ